MIIVYLVFMMWFTEARKQVKEATERLGGQYSPHLHPHCTHLVVQISLILCIFVSLLRIAMYDALFFNFLRSKLKNDSIGSVKWHE